jgi:hypothetical protein
MRISEIEWSPDDPEEHEYQTVRATLAAEADQLMQESSAWRSCWSMFDTFAMTELILTNPCKEHAIIRLDQMIAALKTISAWRRRMT